MPGVAAGKHFGSISMNMKWMSEPQSPQARFFTLSQRGLGISGSGTSA